VKFCKLEAKKAISSFVYSHQLVAYLPAHNVAASEEHTAITKLVNEAIFA